MSFSLCIDINELLRLEQEPYKTPFGWIKGILMPSMRSMLFDALSRGECEHEIHYKKAEYVLEYYFTYVSMYPRVEAIEFEEEIYREQKGLQIAESEREKLMSFFMLQKTKELYNLFGVEVVHWITSIREELSEGPYVEETKELEKQKSEIDAIKAKANLLSASLVNKVDMANLPQLKKRD